MSPADVAVPRNARSPAPAAPPALSPTATPAPESPTPAPAAKTATPAPPSRHTSVAPERGATPALKAASSPAPPPDTADASDAGDAVETEGTIDLETFNQILDLDEDDTHDFSKEMVTAYFSQANTTFGEMDDAYAEKNLGKLSSLGHFLKGSSAALGVAHVQASCERIQHYGQLRDEDIGVDLTSDAALQKIEPLLGRVKKEYAVAEAWLKKWYEDNTDDAE